MKKLLTVETSNLQYIKAKLQHRGVGIVNSKNCHNCNVLNLRLGTEAIGIITQTNSDCLEIYSTLEIDVHPDYFVCILGEIEEFTI